MKHNAKEGRKEGRVLKHKNTVPLLDKKRKEEERKDVNPVISEDNEKRL